MANDDYDEIDYLFLLGKKIVKGTPGFIKGTFEIGTKIVQFSSATVDFAAKLTAKPIIGGYKMAVHIDGLIKKLQQKKIQEKKVLISQVYQAWVLCNNKYTAIKGRVYLKELESQYGERKVNDIYKQIDKIEREEDQSTSSNE
jgi:hypothetical protein